MAYPSASSLPRSDGTRAWRRTRHRPWTRVSDITRLERLLAHIPSLPRASLSRLTTRLIERMDQIDGDPDLEGVHDD